MVRKVPSVAIVGRPNVGKSTLFNRIVGGRRAIVHEMPGVTRDIQKGQAEWTGVPFAVTDTGGLFSGVDDDLIGQVEERAVREALGSDVLLLVTDAKTGMVPTDVEVAQRVRGAGVPVLVVVNKVEAKSTQNAAGDFYRLGFEQVFEISALHGEGIGDLLDAVAAFLPRYDLSEVTPDLKLAVIGMPNVGKSSLVNALVGSDVNIVDERPGTTRDSIDVSIAWHGKRITLVDTAGIKRKARTRDGVTAISALKSIEQIERCDVAVLMLDASRKISNQDVKVASYAHKAARGIVVCYNKWDLVDKSDKTYREYELDFRDRFGFISYAPVLFISVLASQRISKVIETAWRIKGEREKRIATADFNRFLEAVTQSNPPPYHEGGNGRVYYGTQVEITPPTFNLFVNRTRYFGRNYLRFLNNRIRDTFGFNGTLIRINLTEKKGESPAKPRPPRRGSRP
jgi:GTP-binding protein